MQSLSEMVTSVWVLPARDTLICVKLLPGMFDTVSDSNLYCVGHQPSLWELGHHRSNSPRFLVFHPAITTHPPKNISDSACPMPLPALASTGLDATCSSGQFLVLLSLRSFNISCCSQLWCREKQATGQDCLKATDAESIHQAAARAGATHLGKRSFCAQTLKHDSFSDKHQLQTFWCANNLLSTSTRKKKKNIHSIQHFTCLLCTLFHNSWNTNDQLLGCSPRLF